MDQRAGLQPRAGVLVEQPAGGTLIFPVEQEMPAATVMAQSARLEETAAAVISVAAVEAVTQT